MGKDLAYVRAICFVGGTFRGRTWNGKRNRTSDLKFHSGDGARKLDSIMSHQLLLPLKGLSAPGEMASQMLETRNERVPEI